MRRQAARQIDYEAELMKDIASYSDNPLGFVMYAFPWGEGELQDKTGPEEWQAELLTAVGNGLLTVNEAILIAIASGHGIGKSALVCWLILWGLSTMEDTRGVVTANTEAQLKTKTWAELAKWHRLFIAKHWFTLTATAIFSVDKDHEKTWRVDMIPWSINNTEAFAGLHNEGKRILLIFDEASVIPDKIFEVSEGALTDINTQIIWAVFGNPTQNTGRFRDCFGRFKHRWLCKQIDSRSVTLTNKAQIEEWINDYGYDSDFVKVRVRGMFPAMSAKQFYSVEDMDKAFGKFLRKEQYDFAPKILTVDPAWEGDDMMEIGMRQGLLFRLLRTIPKNDNDITMANLIAQIEDDEKADAVFIDGGFGTGIISAGKTWGRSWQIVWFASESSDPGCYNKRAQMANAAKKWLKDGGALPDNKELYEDILCPETVPRTDGKIQLESKKEIKKRLGRSPGKFDAWVLSFAYPVAAKVHPGRSLGTVPGIVAEYDPFAGGN
jgi:hypothetical protein